MKKKLVLAIITSVLLLSLVAEVQVGRLAEANPWLFVTFGPPLPGTIPPVIAMYSPRNDTVYAFNNVSLSVHITKPQLNASTETGITAVRYTLDNDNDTTGANTVGLYYCTSYSSSSPPGISEFNYRDNLTLPEGNHNITMFCTGIVFADSGAFFISGKSTVCFTVDTSLPEISDVSVENMTYNSKDIPLSFTINETAFWAAYSLDDQANITIRGNTTLSGLSDGYHSLVVYANDTAGNMGFSNKTSFIIDTYAPNPQILYPENKTYNTTSIPLTFTVTEPSTFGYSLDGETNVAATGNATLSGLSDGSHSLVVYARDTAGNVGVSTLAYFTVDTKPPATPPQQSGLLDNFPTEYAYVIAIVAVVATSALLFGLKKRVMHK